MLNALCLLRGLAEGLGRVSSPPSSWRPENQQYVGRVILEHDVVLARSCIDPPTAPAKLASSDFGIIIEVERLFPLRCFALFLEFFFSGPKRV